MVKQWYCGMRVVAAARMDDNGWVNNNDRVFDICILLRDMTLCDFLFL